MGTESRLVAKDLSGREQEVMVNGNKFLFEVMKMFWNDSGNNGTNL